MARDIDDRLLQMTQTAPDCQESPALAGALPGLVHGFTSDLSADGRRDFAESLAEHVQGRFGALPALHLLRQVHSADVVAAPNGSRGRFGSPRAAAEPPTADGITLPAGAPALVAVQVADCVPVLAADRHGGRVAALHAGWRGTAAGILPNLLRHWLEGGTPPEAITLALGPSIRACCYEVGRDCLARFDEHDLAEAVAIREGRLYLELGQVLRNQARAHGLPTGAVSQLPDCTCCAPAKGTPYASYRGAGSPPPPFTRRNAAYIGFVPEPRRG